MWVLKSAATDVRWAVKSVDVDLLTEAVLLIVDYQTNHEGIERLVELKRTGKVKDKITYSNLYKNDTTKEVKTTDNYTPGYDIDIEACLAGEFTENHEMQDVI